MIWNDKELLTVGEILEAVTAIKTRQDAEVFMRAYGAENPHAKDNIGYMAGYCSHDDAARIYDWFQCSHPIFGTRFPTPEEAFQAGMKLGEYSKKYGSKKAMEMLGFSKPDLSSFQQTLHEVWQEIKSSEE